MEFRQQVVRGALAQATGLVMLGAFVSGFGLWLYLSSHAQSGVLAASGGVDGPILAALGTVVVALGIVLWTRRGTSPVSVDVSPDGVTFGYLDGSSHLAPWDDASLRLGFWCLNPSSSEENRSALMLMLTSKTFQVAPNFRTPVPYSLLAPVVEAAIQAGCRIKSTNDDPRVLTVRQCTMIHGIGIRNDRERIPHPLQHVRHREWGQ